MLIEQNPLMAGFAFLCIAVSQLWMQYANRSGFTKMIPPVDCPAPACRPGPFTL